VFVVGLLFGWLVARTRSLLGVTLAHGVTNITLYLVMPFLGIVAAATAGTSVQNVEELTHDISREVQQLQARGQNSGQASSSGRVLIQARTPTPTPTPSPTPTPTLTPTPPPTPTEPEGPVEETYTVQPGDSLADIAALYSTTVEELLRLNDLPEPSLLYTGQTIVVPQANVHVVAPGETLSAIAERYGTTIDELLRLNNVLDPNNVPVGQALVLPAPP
jgi:LysM repeat protein